MKVKKSILFTILASVVVIGLTCSTSYAALQSNPTTGANPKENNSGNWIKEFRKIETLDGGLGYTETHNETSLLPTTKSNNIDIHMTKSTEYGGMAILAVSSYGNPTTSGKMTSSTGNNSGVMFKNDTNGELVAAVQKWGFNEIANRYFDFYDGSGTDGKTGDALYETRGWRGSNIYWANGMNASSLMRDDHTYGGLFMGGWLAGQARAARGVAICGEGI